MRTSMHVVASAMALVVGGALLAGSLWSPASAASVASGTISDSPGQVAPMPPRPAPGSFIPQPAYGSSGQALVIYTGGSVDDLEVVAGTAGATGVWVQDITGRFQLLPVHGPIFLKSGFAAAFPSANATVNAPSFPQMIAVVLVR